MFPFTITYTSNYKKSPRNCDKKKVLDCVSIYVQNLKGKEITILENGLSFKYSLFGASWDQFAQIEKGKFLLTETTISFKFYMYRLFIVTIIMSGSMAFFTQQLFVGIFFFSVLAIGNWVIALIKFNFFIKDVARKIGDM